MIDQALGSAEPQTEEPNQILKSLSLRHAPNDRVCVGIYQRNGDEKFYLREKFVDGIGAAAALIEVSKNLPQVGAIWSNLQKLRAGATARSKETVESYN